MGLFASYFRVKDERRLILLSHSIPVLVTTGTDITHSQAEGTT
jgi:hypothetical protein